MSLRAETAKVVTLADGDLHRLWRLIAAGANAGEALHDLLPAIVTEYGQVGAALAAEWYDEQRDKAGVARSFVAVPVAPDDRGAHALVGWALEEATDDASLQALILGGVQRRIADHVRDTVTSNAVADRAARGWQRTGGGECKFCEMLIGRGAVYTEATVRFASHDNCNCSAVPAWGGKPVPVKPYTVSPRRLLDADGNPIPDADFERAKAWIDDNMEGAPRRRGASGKAASARQPGGFDALTIAQLENQLRVLEGMPDTEYKRTQMARVRARLAALRRG